MCTYKTCEIRTPPYTGQLTVHHGPNGVHIIEVSLKYQINVLLGIILITLVPKITAIICNVITSD